MLTRGKKMFQSRNFPQGSKLLNNYSDITLYYHIEGDIDIRSHQRDSNYVK